VFRVHLARRGETLYIIETRVNGDSSYYIISFINQTLGQQSQTTNTEITPGISN
jgi:hypothetical protein